MRGKKTLENDIKQLEAKINHFKGVVFDETLGRVKLENQLARINTLSGWEFIKIGLRKIFRPNEK